MFKVLIVEDEDLIRKGLVYIFDWVKYDCVVVGEAANGKEALKMIEKNPPDILITDIRMPIMDGMELLENIKTKSIESIIISGHAEFEYAKKAICYGVSEYILKPIDHNILGMTLAKISEKLSNQHMTKLVSEKVKPFEAIEIIDVEFYYNGSHYKSRYTPKVLDFIKTHYKQKVSIDLVANELEISSASLSKKFKADTNYTFNDFLNRYRIQKALDFMLESDMKIYEIAEKVGFSEYKYFSQVFKNYVNYSPSEFLQIDLFVKKQSD